MGAGRVFAIDAVLGRLALAQSQGAEAIDFNTDDPVEAILELTDGIGVDRAIDAVGIDASHAHRGPAAAKAGAQEDEFRREVKQNAPAARPQGDNWHPGDAPSQALQWAVDALAKAGSLSVIGVYGQSATRFPIGKAMAKNLTLKAGNCNHRKYIPMLMDLLRAGEVEVAQALTRQEPLGSAIEAFQAFDRRQPGWVKVRLDTAPVRATGGDGRRRQDQRPTP
jgi:threonine dehydrogenase-like Zn-dependent dehydrogenase